MRKYVILRRQPLAADEGYRNLGAERAPAFSFERLTQSSAAAVAAEPEVEAIAPVMGTRLVEPRSAEDGLLPDVWGLNAIGACATPYTGDGVVVAVLDTGIDESHPAFAGIELRQRDFSGDGVDDRNGHGTHCAGTIFGRDVDGHRIGVARGVERCLIGKVLDDRGGGDIQMIVEGLQWALSGGANIVAISLGFDFPGMVRSWVEEGWPIDLATSNALEAYRVNLRIFDALMRLCEAREGIGTGALVIAAAGNESRRAENPEWRIAVSLPAAADHVVSVAAVGRSGDKLQVAAFSNSGALVSGPGVGILSASNGGGLRALSGTSMACPHVAGAAALWWEAIRKGGRTPTPINVRAALIASARIDSFCDTAAEVDVGQGLVATPL